jgi:hypothetical protein
MERCFRKYLPVLVTAAAATVACSDAAPASPTDPSLLQTAAVTVEPMIVRPEFLPGLFCAAHPPFRGNVVVVLGGPQDIIVRGLHFTFHHRLGGRTLPTVFPTPTASGAILTTPPYGPVPTPGFATLPGASPVPIPGASSIEGVLLHAQTLRRMPFTLEFGCGVPADGTLVIKADSADRRGTWYATEVKVEIRG